MNAAKFSNMLAQKEDARASNDNRHVVITSGRIDSEREEGLAPAPTPTPILIEKTCCAPPTERPNRAPVVLVR